MSDNRPRCKGEACDGYIHLGSPPTWCPNALTEYHPAGPLRTMSSKDPLERLRMFETYLDSQSTEVSDKLRTRYHNLRYIHGICDSLDIIAREADCKDKW